MERIVLRNKKLTVAVVADRTAYDVRRIATDRCLDSEIAVVVSTLIYSFELCFWCPSAFSPFMAKRHIIQQKF